MSEWLPDYIPTASRRYLEIADALASDIRRGVLKPGDRLPTHRDLAFRLGISINTISKAYALAARRQHVTSTVGRGSYVLSSAWSARARLDLDEDHAGEIDLSFNCPVLDGMHGAALADTLAQISTSPEMINLQEYHRPWTGMRSHREAAALWLERSGMPAKPDDVLITAGAQHASSVVLSSLTRPGDCVVTEELTDPGIKLLCAQQHLRLRGLAIDGMGIIPDAFEAACRAERVTTLVCMPNHHSPTLATMTEARRASLAGLAAQYDVTIIENDVYGAFIGGPLPALSRHAPERSFYLSSLSKIMSPGLRLGFLAVPSGRSADLLAGLGATCWMASPISAEIGSLWIRNGTAERLAAWQRAELAQRHGLVRAILGHLSIATLPTSTHAWLRLPEPWRADGLTKQLRSCGIWVTPSEAFAVGQGAAPQAIRISLGGSTKSREELRRGLELIAETLAGRPAPNFVI